MSVSISTASSCSQRLGCGTTAEKLPEYATLLMARKRYLLDVKLKMTRIMMKIGGGGRILEFV